MGLVKQFQLQAAAAAYDCGAPASASVGAAGTDFSEELARLRAENEALKQQVVQGNDQGATREHSIGADTPMVCAPVSLPGEGNASGWEHPSSPGQWFPGQQTGQPGQQSMYRGNSGGSSDSYYSGKVSQRSSYPCLPSQHGSFPGQQGQQGRYPCQQTQPEPYPGQQGQQLQGGQAMPDANQYPSHQGGAAAGRAGDLSGGASRGCSPTSADRLQSKIETVIQSNMLETFYPPYKLQQLLQRLQQTDFKYANNTQLSTNVPVF